MYEASFGLGTAPFRLLPDPRFYLDDGQYGQVLAELIKGLEAGEPCLLLTGPPGSGKTAAVQRLLMLLDRSRWTVGAMFASPDAAGADVLNAVVYAFNLARADIEPGPAFDAWLKRQTAQGGRVLLVVDEAENLDEGALHQLAGRLVGRHGAAGLQLCLVGQQAPAALADAVRQGALPPVSVHCRLRALDATETRDYVLHRLRRAGWKGRPAFDRAATDAIHRRSEGIPRRIHLIAERVLLHLSLDDADVATAAAVEIADDTRTVELQGRAATEARPADAASRSRGGPATGTPSSGRKPDAQRAEPPTLPPLPAGPTEVPATHSAPPAPPAALVPPTPSASPPSSDLPASPATPPTPAPGDVTLDGFQTAWPRAASTGATPHATVTATPAGAPPAETADTSATGVVPEPEAAPRRPAARSGKTAAAAALLALATLGVAWWIGFGGTVLHPPAARNSELANAPTSAPTKAPPNVPAPSETPVASTPGETVRPTADSAQPGVAAPPAAEQAPLVQNAPAPAPTTAPTTAPAAASPPRPATAVNGAGGPQPPAPTAPARANTAAAEPSPSPASPTTGACTPTAAVLGLCEPATARVQAAPPPMPAPAPSAEVAAPEPPPAVPPAAPAAPCDPSREALGLCER